MRARDRFLRSVAVCASICLTVTTSAQALPDLLITTPSGGYTPDHGRPNDEITFAIVVKNQGMSPTVDDFPAVVRFYLSSCSTGTEWEISGNDCFQPHLGVGGSGTVNCVGIVPNLVPGLYAFWAKCDAYNNEPESNENNNCKYLGLFEIDAVPCNVAHPQPVYTNCSLTWAASEGWARGKNYLEVTVRNDGPVDADVGAITFSFPAMVGGLDSTLYRAITADTWTSPVATIVKALPGATIYRSTCAGQPASYLLLEAVWNDWRAGESRTFGVEIDRIAFSCFPGGLELPGSQNPCASGHVLPAGQQGMLRPGEDREFWVQYRSALHCLAGGASACNWYDSSTICDPLTAPGHTGRLTYDDQQGWLVRGINIVAELPETQCQTCVDIGSASWSAVKSMFRK